MMTKAKLQDDYTLDELRFRIAPLLAGHAAFDGWNENAVRAASAEAGVDPDIGALAMKTHGRLRPIALVDAWIESIDLEMAQRLPTEKLATMKIRARISALVQARLAIMASQREALRRAMATMAMPLNLPEAARIAWRSADAMWRLAGDDATDFNHYTKRVTLSAVYGSTLSVFINDESDGYAETLAFLDRRIENVMQFEKWKFQAKGRRENLPSMSRFIGRLRYPPR